MLILRRFSISALLLSGFISVKLFCQTPAPSPLPGAPAKADAAAPVAVDHSQ